MKRRSFISHTTVLPVGASLGLNFNSKKSENQQAYSFKMKYAPHLGMFKHHAGDDPIDQLNFMADMGFRAFEDNGMKGREIGLQEKMASTMYSVMCTIVSEQLPLPSHTLKPIPFMQKCHSTPLPVQFQWVSHTPRRSALP